MASIAPITAPIEAATPTQETATAAKSKAPPLASATQQEPSTSTSATQQAAATQDTVTLSAAALPSTAQPISSQVVLLSAQGESVQEIAQQLGISPQAVQSYLG